MKRFKGIWFILTLLLSACLPERDLLPPDRYPDGTPVTMYLSFGTRDFLDVQIGTKAEASPADESRVHDLYVMLFDSEGKKFYGRYFTFEHLAASLNALNSQSNEGWYVENSTSQTEVTTQTAAGSHTRGVVKLSTESKQNCTLVVLANISNTINYLDGKDPIDRLSEIQTLTKLNEVKVTLEQEIVIRANLFLMLGKSEGVDTGSLTWNTLPTGEAPDFSDAKIKLETLDAKIKFCVTYNEAGTEPEDRNIDPSRSMPRYWQVHNVPSSSYLMPRPDDPDEVTYFNTAEAYFDGTETIEGREWQVFTFYMLENRKEAKKSIESLNTPNYYFREKQIKEPVDADYVKNGAWEYAPDKGTYVQFDMVLGLTQKGVSDILGYQSHALTSEALFTVHMGDFTSSQGNAHHYDEYSVERNHAYIYYITVVNSKKIYVEVMRDSEDEPGQEGSLLLTTEEIVNCDAHYENHSLTFVYTPDIIDKDKGVSWYVKTPFSEGGAQWIRNTHNWDQDWEIDCKDYLWVKFAVNEINAGEYVDIRKKYPGFKEYSKDPGDYTYRHDWNPSKGDHPDLMDIHQLILYLFDQTQKQKNTLDHPLSPEANDFILMDPSKAYQPDPTIADYNPYIIRATAFVDEYYYEKDPTDPEATADPNLWRKFVNAKPRELHILADSHYSKDKQSDVIRSSHSIIQQSIQSLYNIYSPGLNTLWGIEHQDEMSYYNRVAKKGDETPWPWWDGSSSPSGCKNDENGRANTAAIWGMDSAPEWETFLNYAVDNNTPELNATHKYLAYSCLTRNRDNNGNGVIDPEELRWYTAAKNQIVGIWVGTESLTPSARLYQPKDASNNSDGRLWRAWVISSTAPKDRSIQDPYTIRAEEGCTISYYSVYDWVTQPFTFTTNERNMVSSIRCVRNIGTFQQGGVTTDISYAPFDKPVSKYYEVVAGEDADGKAKANADGTYTIRFSHLNPKSIREYSSEDLPSHQEYSEQNKVYLELNVQNPANYQIADGSFPNEDAEVVNNTITSKGYNKYCPAGYRLPNMTELLLMVSILPSDYWRNSPSTMYPSRTFYSHGKLGKQTAGEAQKIGWSYSTSTGRVNMINENTSLTGIRCVRDDNCIGEITGAISVPGGDNLHTGEDITIELNFSSQGAAIKDFALSLVYVGANGRETTEEIPLPADLDLTGMTLRSNVPYTIPADLPLLGSMCIRATVRNSAGVTRTFETPIKVYSPTFASVRLLHCNYVETECAGYTDEEPYCPSFPVLVTASSPSDDITAWKLTIVDPDGETTSVDLSNEIQNNKNLSYVYNFSYTAGSLLVGTYTFQTEVTTYDVANHKYTTTRSEIASMEILQVNSCFNTGESYSIATEIDNPWETQKIMDLDFYAGDFIEADMDVSNCTYVRYPAEGNRDGNKSIRLDNLISLGLTDTDHNNSISVPYVLHFFYPSRDNDNDDWLKVNISTSGGSSNALNYNRFSASEGSGFSLYNNYAVPKRTVYQHFRFEKTGVYWNDQAMDFDNWGAGAANAHASIDRLLSANTLYIGSTQGYHRSRARYVFVRVVHNSASSNAAGGKGTNFDDGPNNGGTL